MAKLSDRIRPNGSAATGQPHEASRDSIGSFVTTNSPSALTSHPRLSLDAHHDASIESLIDDR